MASAQRRGFSVMSLIWEKRGRIYFLDEDCINISIPMDFAENEHSARQPNHFGANEAKKSPMKNGMFIGDIAQGGSCNAFELTINPHCNGTHTETSWHISASGPAPYEQMRRPFFLCALISIEPTEIGDETYSVLLDKGEKVITKEKILRALADFPEKPEAIVIRTLPNDVQKREMSWTNEKSFPFLTLEAAKLLSDLEVEHLVVDVPSVDRANDDGHLSVHKTFFGGSGKTISEMAYIDADVTDGIYALRYGLAALKNDAVPSSIYLHPLKEK
jgi:kynurenine formamidase